MTVLIISACMFILGAAARSYALMAVSAGLIVIIVLEYILLLNKYARINMKRLQETVHAPQCEYTTSFNDAGFKIRNHATNAEAVIAYDDIIRFVETATVYVLFTRAGQFGLVNKLTIDGEGRREEFISYLRDKCKSVRW